MLEVKINGTLPEDRAERRKIFVDAATQAAYQLYQDYEDPDSKIRLMGKPFIAYTRDTAHARSLRSYFSEQIGKALDDDPSILQRKKYEHFAEAISGKESDKIQDAVLERLRSGKTLGVGNAELWREGADIPAVKVVISNPTASRVKKIQTVGRGGRMIQDLPKNDPRQHAYVVSLFFRVNGKIVGKPVFYHQLVDAAELGQLVSTTIDLGGTTGVGGNTRGRNGGEDLGGDIDIDVEGGNGGNGNEPVRPPKIPVKKLPLVISSNIEDVRRIDDEVAGALYPEKTDKNYLSNSIFSKLIGEYKTIGDVGSTPAFSEIWSRIEAAYQKDPNNPVVDGHKVNCGLFSSDGKINFYVHSDEQNWYKAKLGKKLITVIGDKNNNPDVLGKTEFARLVGGATGKVGYFTPAFENLWSEIGNACCENLQAPEIEGHKIKAGYYRNGRHIILCVDKIEEGWGRKCLGTELKTENLLTKRQFADLVGGVIREGSKVSYTKNFEALWASIESAYEKDPDNPIVDGYRVKCAFKRSGGPHSHLYIDKSEQVWAEKKLGTEKATKEHKIKKDFAKLIGQYKYIGGEKREYTPEFEELWSKAQAAHQKDANNPIVDGHKVHCRTYRPYAFRIHQDEVDWAKQWIAEKIKARKQGIEPAEDDAEDDRAHLKKPRPNQKTDISRGSAHIADRSGRSRKK